MNEINPPQKAVVVVVVVVVNNAATGVTTVVILSAVYIRSDISMGALIMSYDTSVLRAVYEVSNIHLAFGY